MKKNLQFSLFFLFFFIANQKSFGQRCEHIEVDRTILSKDSSKVCYGIKEVPEKIAVILFHDKGETFEFSDTLNRDFIEFGTLKKSIDQLQGLQQCDYTGSYDLIECRWIANRFLVLCFVDLFIIGTNQNAFYVLFEYENDNWKYLKSYENEANQSTDIQFIYSPKELKLKGKYLKQIKRQELNCLN